MSSADEVDKLVNHLGLWLTPQQKRIVLKAASFDQVYRSSHAQGNAWDMNWRRPTLGGVVIDGREVRVTLPETSFYRRLRPTYDIVIYELHDHIVKYNESTYWAYSTKPSVRCTCGWKNSGDDCGTRAEAHIRKLREWLDEHPEEEVMAGFGGQIAWPKKQPQPRKKKAFKNKRKRR